jgi:hypothetical protein
LCSRAALAEQHQRERQEDRENSSKG